MPMCDNRLLTSGERILPILGLLGSYRHVSGWGDRSGGSDPDHLGDAFGAAFRL